jgi:NAD(P)H-hydrate epimerase
MRFLFLLADVAKLQAMQKVLTAAQMREVDRLTTEKYGIPSILLMENAAHAVVRVITERLGTNIHASVLCGKGSNGGDGAAIARILWSQGADVDVFLFGTVEDTKRDARTNFDAIKKISERDPPSSPYLFLYENKELDYQTKQMILRSHVIVDAVLGTGLTRPIESAVSELFKHIKTGKKFLPRPPFLISVDLPSGLNADTEADYPDAFEADCTVTFTAPKPANVLAPNYRMNGELIVAQIGSPYDLLDESPSDLEIPEEDDVTDWLKRLEFSNDSYKNKRGHTLLIAGSESYSGAAVLCGNAAMRSGVGLVTIATPKSSKDSVASRVSPEVMVRGVAETENGSISEAAFDEIQDLVEKADAVAIGSGISRDESTKKFVQRVIKNRRQPIVVDADALNLLSPFAGFAANGESQFPLILTPHEGEFMRMLGSDDKDILKERVAAVRDFSVKHHVILVLKGERVLIGEPGGKVVVNPTGNSGLGKAGNGDTLTGILAGFAAQAVQFKIDIFETVVAAVYVAGMAGDVAEKKYGKRVMTASDVRECLTDVFETLAGD